METPKQYPHSPDTTPPQPIEDDKWGDLHVQAQDLVDRPLENSNAEASSEAANVPDIDHSGAQDPYARDYADPDAANTKWWSEPRYRVIPADDVATENPVVEPSDEWPPISPPPTPSRVKFDDLDVPDFLRSEPSDQRAEREAPAAPVWPSYRAGKQPEDDKEAPARDEQSTNSDYKPYDPDLDYDRYDDEEPEPEEWESLPIEPDEVIPARSSTDTSDSSSEDYASGPAFIDKRGKLRRGLSHLRPSRWMAKAAARSLSKSWDRKVTSREAWEEHLTPGERTRARRLEGIFTLTTVVALGTIAVKSIPSLRFIGEHVETAMDWAGLDGQFGPGAGGPPHVEHPGSSPSSSHATPSQHPTPGGSKAPTPGATETPKPPAATTAPQPTATGSAPAPGATPGTGNGAPAGESTAGLGSAGGADTGTGEQNSTTGIPEHIELTVENGGMRKGDGSWTWSDRHLKEAAKAAGIDPDQLTNAQKAEVQKAFLEDKDNAGKFYGDGRMNLLDKDGKPMVYGGDDATAKINSIIEKIKAGDNSSSQAASTSAETANAEPNLQPNPNGQAVDPNVEKYSNIPEINEGTLEELNTKVTIESGDSWEDVFNRINEVSGQTVIVKEHFDKIIHDKGFQELMNKPHEGHPGFDLGYTEGTDYRVHMPRQGDNGTHPLPQGALEAILDRYGQMYDEGLLDDLDDEEEEATV